MSAPAPTPAPTPRPASVPPGKKPDTAAAVTTQGRVDFRKRLPVWVQELPQFGNFKPAEPDPNYQLLSRADLQEVIKDLSPEAQKQIFDDMDFMEYELLRLFRERDHTAKFNQNRYRRQQIYFLTLAVAATLIGSLQVVALNNSPEVMPLFAFLETLVALLTAFLAAVGGREPPQERWLNNRRRAEQMRREYFRYLTHMPPYDEVSGYQRRMLLSQRAADINRGMYPQELSGQTTGGEGGSV